MSKTPEVSKVGNEGAKAEIKQAISEINGNLSVALSSVYAAVPAIRPGDVNAKRCAFILGKCERLISLKHEMLGLLEEIDCLLP